MRRLRLVLPAALMCAFMSVAALAHQLNVFAYVEDGEVVVEAKFSNGKRPVSGEVRVLDNEEKVLTVLQLRGDGTQRFPLSSVDHAKGLLIEVETGEGHDDYWILTPEDIQRGANG